MSGIPAISVDVEGEAVSKPPFFAFLSGEDDIAVLRQFAEHKKLPESNILKGDIEAAADFLKSNNSPEVLLVEIGSQEQAQTQLSHLAEVCDSDTKVIIVGTVNEYSFYCWLMDLGISSYLLKPLSEESLTTAWDKAIAPPAAANSQENKPGKVCSFISSRGGVGNTSLAIFTAAILGQHAGKKIALVDLDPQDGSISLLLDLEPSKGFREVLERPDRIDGLYLDKVMQKAPQNISILSAEESLKEKVKASAEAANILIQELQAGFDIILLDVPRHLNEFYTQCLKLSEQVFIVTELTLQGLRDTMRLEEHLKEYVHVAELHTIANRTGMAPKHEMLKVDFNKGMNGKLAATVPFSPEVFMEISGDFEVAKLKNKDTKKALDAIAKLIDDTGVEISEPQTEEQDKQKGKLGGWLKKGK